MFSSIQDVRQEDQSTVHGSAQTPQQLTPIVVTEKKIISLKKKDVPVEHYPNPNTTTTKVVRNIPTAKVFPESIRNAGTTAVVKPVLKTNVRTVVASAGAQSKHSHHHNHKNASEFEDEDELLADSPSSSPTHVHSESSSATPSSSHKTSLTPPTTESQPSRFANRRVVLKSSDPNASLAFGAKQSQNKLDRKPSSSSSSASSRVTSAAVTSKGVFDRLDRKVVNASDAAKRKIQRIVIQNTD